METGDITGSTLRDHSGNGRDGAIAGAPVIGTGHVGGALDFTATASAYVDIASVPLDGLAGSAVTVSLWFRRAGGVVNEVLVDFPPPQVALRYDLWLVNGNLCINTQSSECWGFADASLADRWVHAVAVLRNGPEIDSEIYLDGEPRGMGCSMATCDMSRTVTNPLRLGSQFVAGDDYSFHGMLDEVRLYDRALSPPEIAALFAGTTCPP